MERSRRVGARRSSRAIRRMMWARRHTASAAVPRQCHYCGAETAQRES